MELIQLIKKIKHSIYDYIPYILFTIFFVSALTFWVIDVGQDQSELQYETQLLTTFVKSEIEEDISSRIELIDIFVNEWVNTQKYENVVDYERFLQKVPYYFNFYPGYLAINWINASGVISWVYPYEANLAALNRSIVNLLSGAENTAFSKARDEGLVGMTNVTTLFQGGMGLVTYHPLIYYNISTNESELVGYFNTVFQIDPLIEEIVDEIPIITDFSFKVYEYNATVYHYQEEFDQDSKFCFSEQINFYGRTWDIFLSPNQSIISQTRFFAKWQYA
ncbi:MAG: CHASE domain-containing protein, partial [Candidatus Heimdallarchaeota archaeon]|nr:CHASE domain-containing protein [Candidatus Heimdallarchaeota archaeon]